MTAEVPMKIHLKHLCRPGCRTGMPNSYAEQLDTETTFGKESAPEGYAEQGMPNRYDEQVCQTGMSNTYAEKVLPEVSFRYQH